MLNLKKTAVAVLALGSSAVFAGSMGPVCSAVNVTVPCETTAWDFGAKALYLQPALSGGFSETTVAAGTGPGRQFGRNAQYNWGFMIEGSYHFNTGNDLNLNWYHLSNSSTRNFVGGGLFPINMGALATVTVSPGPSTVSIDPHWDAVNMEVGQHVDFGENKSIRFHGGAQYARLTNTTNFSGSNAVSAVTPLGVIAGVYSATGSMSPTYNGFGPRLGADMAYDWGNGLGLYANGAAAILAGSSKFSTAYSDSLGNVVSTNTSKTAVVPVMDAKLGATYTYAMAQGDLTLDAGWMWVNYFSVNQNVASLVGGTDHDFGLQGPFIGLKWLGNVA